MTRTTLPTRAELLHAIACAVRAPSVHNSQPWLFRLLDNGVEVFADWRRHLTVADPRGRALRVSCGAAVLNLRLSLQYMGFTPKVDVGFEQDGPLARVCVIGTSRPTLADTALYDAIAHRHSNRYPFLDTTVSLSERAALVEAAEEEGAWLSLIIGPAALDLVAAIVRIADGILNADPDYRAELASWSRTDPMSPDGVSQMAGGPAPDLHELLVRRDFGGAPQPSGREFEQEPFVAVLGTFVDSPTTDLIAGQALQRVLLTATREGLSASLTSQPVDVGSVREQLRLGLRRQGPPHMLLRLGRSVPGPVTLRRPVEDVIVAGDHQARPAPVVPAR